MSEEVWKVWGAYHERERLCPEGVRVGVIAHVCTLRQRDRERDPTPHTDTRATRVARTEKDARSRGAPEEGTPLLAVLPKTVFSHTE